MLFELAAKRALFPGQSEIDQLFSIFRVMGTPTENEWAGCTQLRGWLPTLPRYPRVDFVSEYNLLTHLGPDGVDLMYRMLQYDPQKRITVAEALRHPFLVERFSETQHVEERAESGVGVGANTAGCQNDDDDEEDEEEGEDGHREGEEEEDSEYGWKDADEDEDHEATEHLSESQREHLSRCPELASESSVQDAIELPQAKKARTS
jgi:serine/threonine protein kinase